MQSLQQTGDNEHKAVNGMTTQLQIAQILRSISSNSRPDPTDDRLRFLPRDALFDIISADVVLDLFQSRPQLPEEWQADLREVVNRISPAANGCRCRKFHCTGSRIIFAALLSLSKPELIGAVVQRPKQTICDASLPEKSWSTERTNDLLEALNGTLSPGELERFLHFTWQMRSPFMQDLASQDASVVVNKILEYPANVSLPWTLWEAPRAPDEGTFDTERTSIRKITVHSAHRDDGKLDGLLALKISDDYQAETKYKDEVAANLRIKQHDHIVPLLAAFKHRGKFYLVLPWAHEGNLADLFQRYSTPMATAVDGQIAADWFSEKWLLAQCLGLAEGLAVVHQTPTPRQIHADIKPENILCFATNDGDSNAFTLKLADFGEAQQVHPVKGTISVKRIPHTKTYRPPEHDTDEALKLNYDVWCLACVFLEFLTWAIAGSGALTKFEEDRLEERDERKATTARGDVKSDTFFKKTSVSASRLTFPRIKLKHNTKTIDDGDLPRSDYRRRHRWWLEYTGSTRIKTLRKKAIQDHITFLEGKCADTRLRTFLNFISSSMLVVDPTQRAQSSAVRTFLEGLQE